MKVLVFIVYLTVGVFYVAVGTQVHECDFPREDGRFLFAKEFRDKYMNTKTPVVINNVMNYTDGRPWRAFSSWDFDNIENHFGAQSLFRVGPGPYPSEEQTLHDFLQQMKKSKSGEMPNIFQYGQVPTSWMIWAHKRECISHIGYLHPNSRPMHQNASFLCDKIMSQIQVPRFLSEEDEATRIPPLMVTHSGLLIGPIGSGIDFHKHQDAINLIFHGEKRWFMKVPKSVAAEKNLVPACDNEQDLENEIVSKVCQAQKDRNNKAFAEILKTKQNTEELDDDAYVLTCVQKEGEVVYIPDHYQHAVLNLKDTVAMQMQWYNGDWKNYKVRRYLQQHFLNSLDPSFRSPDTYQSMDEMLTAMGWNLEAYPREK